MCSLHSIYQTRIAFRERSQLLLAMVVRMIHTIWCGIGEYISGRHFRGYVIGRRGKGITQYQGRRAIQVSRGFVFCAPNKPKNNNGTGHRNETWTKIPNHNPSTKRALRKRRLAFARWGPGPLRARWYHPLPRSEVVLDRIGQGQMNGQSKLGPVGLL